eukprot:gene16019-19067_t
MIEATPAALKRVLADETTKIKELAKVLVSNDINKVFIIGVGTSWHASLNTRHFIRNISKLTSAEAWNSFEFIEQDPAIDRHCAVLIFSHRGIKKYSYDSFMRAKSRGCYTVLFTSTVSPVVDCLDMVIRTSISDQAAAFTVSHTSATYCGFMLAIEMGLLRKTTLASELQSYIAHIPGFVERVLEPAVHDKFKLWASKFKDQSYLPFVGYLSNESNCYEVALKIKEAAYVIAEGYQLEQFIHGPFVATDANTILTCIISSSDTARERTHQLIKAAKHVGAKVAAITQEDDNTTESIIGEDGITIKLPIVPEAVSVFTNLVGLQLLTYYLSLEKGTNPDTFRKHIAPHDEAFIKSGLSL